MTDSSLTRRELLTGLAAMTAFAALPSAARASFSQPARALSFENLHTGERLKLTYWEKGSYVPGALREINHVLRDHRNGKVAAIDPRLLDTLVLLQNRLETKTGFQVISGYRSPESNAKMHARSGGVAKHSLHMEGKAIDIRIPGKSLSNVHTAALSLQAGGVGYYPTSNFVHVDTGRVRKWGGA